MRMTIAGRPIGSGHPLFVIAEIGLNHGGSLGEALSLVDAAARAGASAVKLQTLRGETLVAAECPAPAHVGCRSLREFFAGFELNEHAHARVAERAHALGLAFMSTPFDEAAVGMLERVGCDAYKIASGDVTHHRLIATAARTGRPMVLSTGMAELAEVSEAVDCARSAGATEIAILHCVSAYPVPPGSENLRTIATLAAAFGVPVGLSDHGTSRDDLLLAVGLGASVYEKHLVLCEASSAIDAPVSATPEGLAALVQQAARASAALGHGARTCLPAELPNRHPSRRALYATRDLFAGDVVQGTDMIALRPAAGLPASAWRALEGQRLTRPVPAGSPFLVCDLKSRRREDQDAA